MAKIRLGRLLNSAATYVHAKTVTHGSPECPSTRPRLLTSKPAVRAWESRWRMRRSSVDGLASSSSSSSSTSRVPSSFMTHMRPGIGAEGGAGGAGRGGGEVDFIACLSL